MAQQQDVCAGLSKRNEELETLVEELTVLLAAAAEGVAAADGGRATRENVRAAVAGTFCSILARLDIGICVVNPQLEILFLNSVMREKFPHIDVGSAPVCYRSFNTPPREEPCSYCPTVPTFTDGATHVAVTETPAEGGRRHFRLTTAPIIADDGKVCAVIEVVEDITERKAAEEAWREMEQRYRGFVEVSPEAIFAHQRGAVCFANSKGAQLLGAERPEDLYGRRALDFVHPDYRELVSRRISHAYQTGEPNPATEEVFLKLDGTPILVEVASAPFKYQGENALQIIARDITDRKRHQDEVLKAQKLESLGVLAGGIAHDFNNILTGIIGNLSLAKSQLAAGDGLLKRLELCEKAAVQAANLTRQLLTFARGGEPFKKKIALDPLIRDAVSFALRGANVKSVVDLQEELWPLEADESQLAQVMNNLLLNAVQAMPSGGVVTVRGKNVRLDEENARQLPPGEYLQISVTDSGCGIARSDLLKIFDPYFTTKAHGTGLGLASVYSIVRKHGGAVEAASTVGEGTTVTLHLPALEGTVTEGDVETEAPQTGIGRVLVMDDEEAIREVAVDILHHLGYEADACADGNDAIALYLSTAERARPYAAVILDLTIPAGLGGKEAAAKIREIDPDAVLIVSSGYSNDPVVANHKHYGFSGVIRKPFGIQAMAQELARLLR